MSSGVTWNLSLAFDKSLTAAFCSGREIDADVVVNIKVSQSWTLGGHLYFFAYKPVSFYNLYQFDATYCDILYTMNVRYDDIYHTKKVWQTLFLKLNLRISW